jgi:uncharacterized delta-60 repeat protein
LTEIPARSILSAGEPVRAGPTADRRPVMLLLLVLAVARPWPASGAAGDLDPRFGTGGKVDLECCSTAFAIRPDGGIVLAGSADDEDPYFALSRLTASGNVDTGFGDQGVTPRADIPSDRASVVMLRSDGKILAAGLGPGPRVVVARFDENGALDDGFGEHGVATKEVDPVDDGLKGIALQPDGTIVVLASVGLVGPDDYECLLTAFGADGEPADAFENGGLVTTNLLCEALAVQGDGAAVLQGHPFFDSGVTLFDASGEPTLTISLDLGPFNDQFGALLVQPDGKVVAGGFKGVGDAANGLDTISDAAVVRGKPDGTLDATFGQSGVATIPLGGPDESEIVQQVALQASGKIVAAGQAAEPFLARLTPAGLPDESFGDAGIVSAPLDAAPIAGIATDPDDNLVVRAGRVLARFIGEPTCGDGIVDTGEACDGGPGCAADCTAAPVSTTTSSTTTTTAAAGPSTTTTVPGGTCGSCDDGDPCTSDACVSGECVHGNVSGTAAVSCTCERAAPAACAGVDLPGKLDRLRERACASAAALGSSTKLRKLLKATGKVARRWRASVRKLDRASDVPAKCADGLRAQLEDAAGRAEALRGALLAGRE